VGLWLFDLCARQIAQETIPEAHRGVINGKWNAITNFFDLMTYLCAVLSPAAEDFWMLVSVSALMVFTAAVTFTCTNLSSMDDTAPYNSIEEVPTACTS
jgi:hypothetical protein